MTSLWTGIRSQRGALAALLLTGVLAFGAPGAQAAAPATGALAPIPALSSRVTDLTQTLSASDRQALETKLTGWEQKSGNQLVVLIVPTTAPEAIEDYSIRVAEAWKIGRKGQDNGAIFLIAKNDHKMRIEVGYGLEGVLTDVTSHRIIEETVTPLFRQGNFVAGINAGVDRIIAVVGSGAPLAAVQPVRQRPATGFDFQTLLILAFVVVPVIGGILSRIFGRALGSTVGGGVIGLGAWILAGSIAMGVGAGIVAFLVMVLFGSAGGIGRRGGLWLPMGGMGGGGFGGGFGGGGGGFSGGGGSFGGGGASGGW